MTEILTESFCERCGTRYTFESSAPRTSRLARVRTLSRGVRNFVMSDESSFSEAMAEARSEEELAATSHQLDAFHQTFNFCLTCRQYTCGDCWNGAEGRCLTCAPLPGQEDIPVPLVAFAEAGALPEAAVDGNGHAETPGDLGSWPEMDLPADRLARVLEPAPELPLEGSEAAAAAAVLASTATPLPEAGVIGVAPGQSLEEAIAAYEAMLATEEAAALEREPEPVTASPIVEVTAAPDELQAAALEGEPEPVTVAEPESVTAAEPEPVTTAEPEPVTTAELEPVTASPIVEVTAAPDELQAAALGGEPDPITVAEPEPVTAAEPGPVHEAPEAAPVDHVEQPTWPAPPPPPAPVVAPGPVARPPVPAPAQPTATAPWLAVAPEDSPPPQWPTAPAFPAPAARRDVPTTLAGRPLLSNAEATALWVASAQEVLGAAPATFGAAPAPVASSSVPQAQPCVNCGLPLSANARFCRRCGSRQG